MLEGSSSVVVAASGGMDSALALALLKEAGWKVHALHFLLPASPQSRKQRANAARRIAAHLNISLEMIDLTEAFQEKVIEPFVREYLEGLTPNPCVRCNELVKFEYLMQYADDRGIPWIATGHYARIKRGKGESQAELWRGRDRGKEQSYFLHRLNCSHLSRIIFPLGEMTKEEVKSQAKEREIIAHSIPESREICFIPGNDYRPFIEHRKEVGEAQKGNIVDDQGHVLGTHKGVYRYTIGQRQGLGVSSSRPYYVKEIRPMSREVVVARREDLYAGAVEADQFNWISGVPPEKEMEALAQVRYRHRASSGRLKVLSPDRVRFVFNRPQWAVTPGQALVCYEGDRVMGGGWIVKGERARPKEGIEF